MLWRNESRPSTASSLNRFTPLPSISNSPSHVAREDSQGQGSRTERRRPSSPVSPGITNADSRNSRDNSSSDVRGTNNINQGTRKSPETKKMGCNQAVTDSVENRTYQDLFKPLRRRVRVVDEPGSDGLVLAVKLPDGSRVQRAFSPRHTLQNVLEYAEHCAQLDLTECQLACSIPLCVYPNLQLTLAQARLPSKTILHVHLPT